MDDIAIATSRTRKDHINAVHDVLKVAKEHDLYFKPEKCTFHAPSINFLGVADDSLLCQVIMLDQKGEQACQDLQPSLMRRQVTCLQLKTIVERSQPLYLYSR
jgi:hypothetical protein